MTRRALVHRERTLEMAHAFLAEVRYDLERAVAAGCDLSPRLRTVHIRPGHATPEFRTLAIPIPPGTAGAPPEVLSTLIARFAATRPPSCMLLALDGVSGGDRGEPCPILIAEARDGAGTRLFWMQPFHVENGRAIWGDAAGGGWQDPDDQELILDAAFGESAPGMSMPLGTETATGAATPATV